MAFVSVLFATAITLSVLLVVLAIPVTLTYQLSWQQNLYGEAKLEWLFGLVRVRLAPSGGKQTSQIENNVDATTRIGESLGKKINPLAALRQKAFRQRICQFGRDLWRVFRKQNICLRIRIGLGDPAETGQLWALLGPLSGLLTNFEDASIELEPEFVDAIFELGSSGKISVSPLRLVYLVLGLMCSAPFWRGMKQMRQAA